MSFKNNIISSSNSCIAVFLLIVIFSLICYMAMNLISFAIKVFNQEDVHVIKEIVYFIVLLKAYRILVFYYERMHVNIKYMVEIAIIAPVIEVIFAIDKLNHFTAIFFGCFGIASMVVYFVFYEKIKQLDDANARDF